MLHPNMTSTRIRTILITISMFIANAYLAAASEPVDIPKVAARINGVAIYESELVAIAESRSKKHRQPVSKATEAESLTSFQLKDLDFLIAQELLAQAGASIKPQDIEEKLAKPLASIQGITNDKTFLTKEQQEAQASKLRKTILIDSYLEHKGLLNPKIDDETLRRFYDENRQSFLEPKSVKASHILIRLPKSPTAIQEQAAQDKAEKILAELKQGKDFELLAIQSSDCSSNNDGGNLGFIKQGFMPKEFDTVAFKLKPGEISGIVKTRHGLHIIRVDESKAATTLGFSEVKEYIAGYLRKDYQRKKVDELVNELRKTAQIEVLIN